MQRLVFYFLALTGMGILVVSCAGEGKKKDYMKEGIEIADASFKTLGSQLRGALKEGGVQNAVQYCNFMANPLVDSLSKKNNVKIRRTTFQTRNPENKPREYEREKLIEYARAHKNGEKVSPVVRELEDGTKVFFSPIIIENGLCLTCHGNPGSTVTEEDYVFIQSLYPDDEAVGYQLGDFRGMWSIKFGG
jgi:hypothetical protein